VCFDGFSVVIRQTILQMKTQITCVVAAVNSIFVGSSNELKAATAKLMGTVSAVVLAEA
jgi:hypothetical protein